MKFHALLFTALLLATSAFGQTEVKWRKFKSNEGEFRALMPGEWEHIHQEFGTKDAPTTLHINLHETNKENAADNVKYSISWADLNAHLDSEDPNKLQDLFDEQIDRVVKSKKGGIPVSDTVTKYRGYPGSDVELAYDNDQAKSYLRMFLVKNRLYLLEVSGMGDKINQEALDKFFESLEVKF